MPNRRSTATALPILSITRFMTMMKRKQCPTAEEVTESEPEEEEDEEEEEEEEEEEDIPVLNSDEEEEIRKAFEALSNFTTKFENLENHFKLIEDAIDTASKTLTEDDEKKNGVPLLSTIQCICDWMSHRGLRKYITSNLNNPTKLRREVPIALRRASNPSKLVFKCIGRFYHHHSKAYARRQEAILALELFLLAECFDIDPSIKNEIERVIVVWRNMIAYHGGLGSVDRMVVLGLLLLVAAYGVPSDFGIEDLVQLLRLANLKESLEIAHALQRSPFIMEKMPDIIPEMVKRGMSFLAVDIVCAFKIEDQFPPLAILKSFVIESDNAWKKERAKIRDWPEAFKKTNEKHIVFLKSILKWLDDFDMSHMKIDWKIRKLEKENADIKKRAKLRRITFKGESSEKMRNGELKCPRNTMRNKIMLSAEEGAVGPVDGKNFYDSGLFMGPISGYSGASSVTGAGLSCMDGRGLLPGEGGSHIDGFVPLTNSDAGSFVLA